MCWRPTYLEGAEQLAGYASGRTLAAFGHDGPFLLLGLDETGEFLDAAAAVFPRRTAHLFLHIRHGR